MAVAIQIDGTSAILGIDPELSMTWTSDDRKLARELNAGVPHQPDYRPDPQFAEADAVVKTAIAEGKSASIVMVDEDEDPEGDPRRIY